MVALPKLLHSELETASAVISLTPLTLLKRDGETYAAALRRELGDDLYYQGSWNEVARTFEGLHAESPDVQCHLAMWGLALAQSGKRVAAEEIDDKLASHEEPRRRGHGTWHRAMITAALGGAGAGDWTFSQE